MQRELANSGLSPEEILAKTMLLQKAMQGDRLKTNVPWRERTKFGRAGFSPCRIEWLSWDSAYVLILWNLRQTWHITALGPGNINTIHFIQCLPYSNGRHFSCNPFNFALFMTKLQVMKWNSVPGSHSINYDSLHVSLPFSPTGDNSPAFINKTLQNALNAANLSPSELAKALQIEKVHIRIWRN